jgi:hypothetical protein
MLSVVAAAPEARLDNNSLRGVSASSMIQIIDFHYTVEYFYEMLLRGLSQLIEN